MEKSYKNLNKTFLIGIFLFLASLSFSFAQTGLKFKELSQNLTNNVLITLGVIFMTAAFMFFFYGVVVFIYGRVTGRGDMAELKKGKDFMLWGLIALFVMVSVWGIIKLAQEILGVKGGDMKIEPVKIVMGTAPSTDSTGSGGNSTSNPTGGDDGGDDGDDGGFAKKEGEVCIVLSGLASECATGMQCLGDNGKVLAVGAAGRCQKKPSENNVSKKEFIPGQYFPGDTLEERREAGKELYGTLLVHKCIPVGIGESDFAVEKYTDQHAIFVKAFQKAAGLTPTGSFKEGDSTWTAFSFPSIICKSCSITTPCSTGEKCSSGIEMVNGICLPN